MHTPGPWKWKTVEAKQSVTEHILIGPDVLCRYWRDIAASEDANLIAAAPDLLEALEAIIAMGYDDDPKVWGKATDAIAKAKAA